MVPIHPWQPSESCDIVIRHLAQGRCVALPTESTYEIVASALHPDAVAQLPSKDAPAIVLGSYANLFDWMPLLAGAGSRLFRKMGPGPISLRADGGFRQGLWARLPDATRPLLVCEDRIAIRWPDHAIWEELRQAPFPLVSLPIEGGTSAEETARLLGESVACTIDAGPAQFGVAPGIVHAEGQRCRLIRGGVLTADQLDNLALCRILFICTGNTCRSPMAEVLCAKLLADSFGCLPGDLHRHGFLVQSTGLAAMMGSEASPDAVRVAAEFGADLAPHRSQRATLDLLQWADHLFTMTASHAHALYSVAGIPQPRLLSPDEVEVADPIGGELTDYRACAEQIIQCLKQRLPELLES